MQQNQAKAVDVDRVWPSQQRKRVLQTREPSPLSFAPAHARDLWRSATELVPHAICWTQMARTKNPARSEAEGQQTTQRQRFDNQASDWSIKYCWPASNQTSKQATKPKRKWQSMSINHYASEYVKFEWEVSMKSEKSSQNMLRPRPFIKSWSELKCVGIAPSTKIECLMGNTCKVTKASRQWKWARKQTNKHRYKHAIKMNKHKGSQSLNQAINTAKMMYTWGCCE